MVSLTVAMQAKLTLAGNEKLLGLKTSTPLGHDIYINSY